MRESGWRDLWGAVIETAIPNANGLNLDGNCYRTLEILDAQKWLEGDSDDFRFVCACAGLEPEYVRRKYAESKAAMREAAE